MRRRTLLGTLSASLAAVSGCTSPSGTEGMTDDGTTTQRADETDGSETTSTAQPTGTTATDGGTDELDLREANVMGVSFEQSGDQYRFSVTLLHDVHESRALVSQPERIAFW